MNDATPPRPPALPPPMSPCIHVCVMDHERRYCTGCRRTLDEIANWWSLRDDQKRAVLAALPARSCAPPAR